MKNIRRVALTTVSGAALVFSVSALLVSSTQKPADAFPAFTQKEAKPCGYCHVNQAGGGKRNYRGVFYKQNALTFAAFDDEAEAKKAGEAVGPFPDPKPKTWTAPAGKPADTTTPAETGTPAATPTPAPAPEVKTPSVAEQKAKVAKTEVAYKKAPKSAPAKKAYAGAIADLAHATMLDQSIPPAKRYPEALRLTRKALTLDPTNKTAATDKKLIEDAYKSMGRPIPK